MTDRCSLSHRRLFIVLCTFYVSTLASALYPANEHDTSTEEPSGQTQAFSSTLGGFNLDIPSGWQPQEVPSATIYRCTISPDGVSTDHGHMTLGLQIERTDNYTRDVGKQTSNHKVQATAYLVAATTKEIASQGISCVLSAAPPGSTLEELSRVIAQSKARLPNGGKDVVPVVMVPLESAKTLSGMESFEYDVYVDYDGPNCSYHHFLIGAQKKKWLALHFVSSDCKSLDETRSVFQDIVASLEVDKQWPR